MNLEEIKTVAETLAFAGAGLFFGFKFVAGYLVVNLTIHLSSSRHPSSHQDKDYIVVDLGLEKGDRGTLKIYGARARVRYDGREEIKDFPDITSLDYRAEPFSTSQRTLGFREKIKGQQQSKSPSFLWFSPGEQTTFSTYFEVPSSSICTIDVVVFGKTNYWVKSGQWRASSVLLPKP